MLNSITPVNAFQHKRQLQDKQYKDQLSKVYKGFFEQPKSMKMLSVKLNIDRANICWYCRDFRESNRIGIAKKGICTITKQIVNFYTTNPELLSKSHQLNLFE